MEVQQLKSFYKYCSTEKSTHAQREKFMRDDLINVLDYAVKLSENAEKKPSGSSKKDEK